MNVRAFLSIVGVVASIFGLAFLLAPEPSLKMYGLGAEAQHLMQARYFGGTLLAFGLVLFLARSTTDTTALKAILTATVVGNLIGAAISLWAVVSKLQGPMAWGSVLIYGAFALGAMFFLSRRGAA